MKRIYLFSPIFIIACGGPGFQVAPATETMLQDDAGTPVSDPALITGTANPVPDAGSPVKPANEVAEAGAPEAATADPPKAEASVSDPATIVPEAAAPVAEASAPVIVEASTPVVEAAASDPPSVSFTGSCANDLSGVGNGNFRLMATFTVSSDPATGGIAIANQRKTCAGGNFWDLGANFAANGTFVVGMQTDDTKGNYTVLSDPTPIVDSGLHTITVMRVNGVMSLTVDTTATVSTADLTEFSTLPLLAEKTSPCIGVDGTKPLEGTIDSLCIQTQ